MRIKIGKITQDLPIPNYGREHITQGIWCWCEPNVEPSGEGFLVIHNPTEGSEECHLLKEKGIHNGQKGNGNQDKNL